MEDEVSFSNNESRSGNKTKKVLQYVVAGLSGLSLCLLGVIVMVGTLPYFHPKESKSENERADQHIKAPLPLVNQEGPKDTLPCLTKECVVTSGNILNKMDLSTKPCDDMYQYACGGFLAKKLMPIDVHSIDAKYLTDELFYNAFEKIFVSNSTNIRDTPSNAVAKMKTFYRDCMSTNVEDSEKKAQLFKLMNDLGSSTLSDASVSRFDGARWNLQATLTKYHKMGFFFFFSVHEMTAPQKGTEQAAKILSFQQQGQDSFYERCKAYDKATIDRIYLRSFHLGADMNSLTPKLALILQLISELRYVNHNHHKEYISLRALQEHLGELDLKKYVQDMYGSDDISLDTPVYCPHLNYFISLGNIFRRYTSEVIANYLMLNLIEELSPYLPAPFQNPQVEDRENFCRRKILYYFSPVFTSVYVERYFHSPNKAKVVAIGENIKRKIVENFKYVDWLEDAVKEALAKKAKALKLDLAYPDWILDPNNLDKVYEDVQVPSGEQITSVISIQQEMIKNLYQGHKGYLIGSAPTLDTFTAKYAPDSNSISVATSFLQPPIYSPIFPTPFVYGSMGLTVGRELMHAFDRYHVTLNEKMNTEPSWNPAINNTYMRRARCLVDQYNAYTPDVLKVKDYQTFDEDMCDNEALRHSYRAYKSLGRLDERSLPALDLPHDQLFFLGFAQSLCHLERSNAAQTSISFSKSRFRVIGSVSNSKEFAEAFNCPQNSPMNPENKCLFF